jgi:hypothetical protein
MGESTLLTELAEIVLGDETRASIVIHHEQFHECETTVRSVAEMNTHGFFR